jgi:hypothetical protein
MFISARGGTKEAVREVEVTEYIKLSPNLF